MDAGRASVLTMSALLALFDFGAGEIVLIGILGLLLLLGIVVVGGVIFLIVRATRKPPSSSPTAPPPIPGSKP